MNLRQEQRERALRIISETPWDETHEALSVIDEALAIAMRATRDDFIRWEQQHDAVGLRDEFSINDASALPPEWRCALVARLLRTIAMAYGAGTDYREDAIGQVSLDSDAAATHLRKLLRAILPGLEG